MTGGTAVAAPISQLELPVGSPYPADNLMDWREAPELDVASLSTQILAGEEVVRLTDVTDRVVFDSDPVSIYAFDGQVYTFELGETTITAPSMTENVAFSADSAASVVSWVGQHRNPDGTWISADLTIVRSPKFGLLAAGTVALGSREFRLYPDETTGRHYWYDLDMTKGGAVGEEPINAPSPDVVGLGGESSLPAIAVTSATGRAIVQAAVVAGPIVDVMMVRDVGDGGVTDLQLLQEATGMNLALFNSQITPRVRVARIEPFSGSNTCANPCVTADLLNNVYVHPNFHGIRTLRNQIGADLISYWFIGTLADAAGLGSLPDGSGDAEDKYASIVWANYIGKRLMAHETGHNFGGHHNPEAKPNITVCDEGGRFAYSCGRTVGQLYGPNLDGMTAIAYGTAGNTGLPQAVYSNPAVQFPGLTPGQFMASGTVGNRENARTIDEVAPAVAGYRSAAWGQNPLGCCIVGGVDAVSWGAYSLDVYGKGGDYQIWHRGWDGQSWASWTAVGGYATSDPTVASWAPGHISLFVRGGDNQIWHRQYLNGWSTNNTAPCSQGWCPIGAPPGGATSSPDAVSWGPNHLDVFVRGGDNAIWHSWWTGSAWVPWSSLGGYATSGPSAAASWGTNRIDLFVRGGDNRIYTKPFSSGCWCAAYQPIGTVTAVGDPDAVATSESTVDVFFVNAGWGLYRSSLVPNGASGDWTNPIIGIPGFGTNPNFGLGVTARGIGKLNVYSVNNQNVTESWSG